MVSQSRNRRGCDAETGKQVLTMRGAPTRSIGSFRRGGEPPDSFSDRLLDGQSRRLIRVGSPFPNEPCRE